MERGDESGFQMRIWYPHVLRYLRWCLALSLGPPPAFYTESGLVCLLFPWCLSLERFQVDSVCLLALQGFFILKNYLPRSICFKPKPAFKTGSYDRVCEWVKTADPPLRPHPWPWEQVVKPESLASVTGRQLPRHSALLDDAVLDKSTPIPPLSPFNPFCKTAYEFQNLKLKNGRLEWLTFFLFTISCIKKKP